MAPRDGCDRLAADLTAFVQGELPAERAAEFEAHLASCAGCREAADGIRSVFRLTGAVEDLTPSMRFRRNVEALLRKARSPAPRREGALWRLRTAVAFLRERIRTSPRFRLAAISVGVHSLLLLAFSIVVLPGMTDKGPREFIGAIEKPLVGEEPPVRPGPGNDSASGDPEATGPHPRPHEALLPPLDAPPLPDLRGLPPLRARTEHAAITALLGSTIDDGLKVTRLAAFAGEGEKSLEAVRKALRWLAARQEEDGSFAPIARNPGYRTGVTAAVLLAFLSDGHCHTRGEREFRFVVAKGVDHLLRLQHQSGRHAGLIGPAEGHYAYNHALATLALVETYALDGRRLPRERAARIRAAVSQAIGLLLHSQRTGGGWRYELLPGAVDNDTSVTVFAAMALGAARAAGFAVPKESTDRIAAWLSGVTDEAGEAGYQRAGDRGGQPPTLTAGALLAEELLGLSSVVRDRRAVIVKREIADPHGSLGRNGLLRFYAALAFRLRGEAVLRSMAPVILGRQQADGSFRSGEDLHGVHGGDAFQTALEVLTITTAYHWAGS
ncbi:MAG: zf-HC2 domain-containing protein [Planctomycetes bacterium]|nr:zf-HC2 domain-containing protein [Planctomycetota bacterium]